MKDVKYNKICCERQLERGKGSNVACVVSLFLLEPVSLIAHHRVSRFPSPSKHNHLSFTLPLHIYCTIAIPFLVHVGLLSWESRISSSPAHKL